MTYDVKALQRALQARGLYDGRIDGIVGPKTEKAICDFKRSVGLWARPYVGPLTLEKLFGPDGAPAPATAPDPAAMSLPWVNELGRYLWKHESRDHAIVKEWLASDGKTLGDPAQLPWCGDAVQTAIRLTLPTEPFTGKVGQNPYLARNWLDFGAPCEMSYGAIVVFWRGDRNGSSGHVAIVVGYDRANKRLRCRGGNQSNMISDAWMDEGRVLEHGYRTPSTWLHTLPPAPLMDSAGAVISTNEA